VIAVFFFLTLILTAPNTDGKERKVEVDGAICSFPTEIRQGDVFLLMIKPRDGEIKGVRGKFLGRELYFFEAGGEYRCLIFAGLFDEPGEALLDVKIQWKGEDVSFLREKIKVVKKDFPTERLKLPESKVTLSEEALARAKREKEILDKIWKEKSKRRYWRGSFLLPTNGRIGSQFGARRIINDKPRSPHTGVDIKAPYGAEVLSSNHGKVRFIGDLFFSGNSLIIDHGGGLYTMYFHLSKILVKVGEWVKKGEPIALVGATGRATGPHLHFGVRLQGARVNPYSLFSLPEE
jgi:hypothetical protein